MSSKIVTRFNSIQNQKVKTMKDLLNAGKVLGRSEMKKIMAGSGDNTCVPWNDCTMGYTCAEWNGSKWVCSNCCNA